MEQELMIEQMNRAGKLGLPFLFVVDFLGNDSRFVLSSHQTSIQFVTPLHSNSRTFSNNYTRELQFEKTPVDFQIYRMAFEKIQTAIKRGDSFLTNLTFPTFIQTDLTLEEIFQRSVAPYRLLFPNEFVCFSPECFVKIIDNTIYSYPMKGTIDASIPNAREIILNDNKEKAEHYTIVDLIRNDLSRVANEVTVTKFRFIDEIKTNEKTLFQVSSEIAGRLPDDWRSHIGDILFSMLPAGSISGAPKDATVRSIHDAEIDERGFYTGVFGYFDGRNLDSGVIIRYIEEREGQKYFRSGGGITAKSDCESEYKELIDKVYVSFARNN